MDKTQKDSYEQIQNLFSEITRFVVTNPGDRAKFMPIESKFREDMEAIIKSHPQKLTAD